MSKVDIKSSFTSAGAMPIKVAMHQGLMGDLADYGYIRPVHVQIMPTNACNLKCPFCSCRDRQSREELDPAKLCECISDLKVLRCEAITVTGGGEPLLYPHFLRVVKHAVDRGIEVGLVTNGTRLMGAQGLSLLKWCRISCADGRITDFDVIADVIRENPGVDWAFSYVLSDDPDMANLARCLSFATRHMTHIRVVPDLYLGPRFMESVMKSTQDLMHEWKVPMHNAIWQQRSNFCAGSSRCLISLLKPVIAADGWVYPCCGVQYQGEGMDMMESFRMCRMEDVRRYWSSSPQHVFDGRRCAKCYYSEYNGLLDRVPKVDHRRFV